DRRTISEIAIDPTDANVAYAAVSTFGVNGIGGNGGIWKTLDGGATWTNTTVSITTTQPYSSVRIDPSAPSTVYAAIGNLTGSLLNGVYKTTDGGTTWSLLSGAPNGTTAGRLTVAIAPSNDQVIYVASQSPSTNGLGTFVRSNDGGDTFTDLTTRTPNYMGGQGWYDTTLIVDPADAAVVYAGGAAGANSLIRSTTGGASWTDISNGPSGGPHVDHHGAAFDASGRYLDGNDGGIYRLDDPVAITWTQLNGSISTIQFQGLGLHPTDANVILAGSQDNGTSKFTGNLGW